MNQYVTTNIRLEEEDYLRLKEEAHKKRISLSAVIREKIGGEKSKKGLPKQILSRIRKHARDNAKYFKGVDAVEVIREIRDQSKW